MSQIYEKESLSTTETTILNVIWRANDEISFEELLGTMQATYDPNYKRTTLATFLTRLSNKGYVKSVRRGKYAYITAIIPKEKYRNYILKKTLDYWFDGDKVKMMQQIKNI